MNKFYITGIRRGLGQALSEHVDCVDTLKECDIFINCKHDGFSQVELLYKAASMNKRIINIGSHASDMVRHPEKKTYKYGVQKKALREANMQLFWNGVNTTCLNFGFIDTPRVAHIDTEKMDVQYACDIILWVVRQPHRIKELTVVP